MERECVDALYIVLGILISVSVSRLKASWNDASLRELRRNYVILGKMKMIIVFKFRANDSLNIMNLTLFNNAILSPPH